MKKQEKAYRVLPTIYWAYEKQPRKVHATELAFPKDDYLEETYRKIERWSIERMIVWKMRRQ